MAEKAATEALIVEFKKLVGKLDQYLIVNSISISSIFFIIPLSHIDITPLYFLL
jgi:hypothetical protein